MLEEEEVPEADSELALRRHERRLGRSLSRLAAAQDAYAAAKRNQDRDPERWLETRSQLERAKLAHARVRKTHRLLQQEHHVEHEEQESL